MSYSAADFIRLYIVVKENPMPLRSILFGALLISQTLAFVLTPAAEAKTIGTVVISSAPYNNQPIPISSLPMVRK